MSSEGKILIISHCNSPKLCLVLTKTQRKEIDLLKCPYKRKIPKLSIWKHNEVCHGLSPLLIMRLDNSSSVQPCSHSNTSPVKC